MRKTIVEETWVEEVVICSGSSAVEQVMEESPTKEKA